MLQLPDPTIDELRLSARVRRAGRSHRAVSYCKHNKAVYKSHEKT